jgi:membrane fusion protein (multidrug efflux system)
VTAAVVQTRTFSDRIDALGVAKSNRSVTITSNTTEQITRVLFTSGQSVRQGQVLVQLEAGEQQADVVQAQANVRQAERDYARQRTLFQKGFVAQARLDDAQAAVDTARAQLGAQRARAGDRTIRAPFPGVIGLSDAAAGQLITPGVEIATLDDLSRINVDFQVPERYLNILRPGVPIEARADAFPDQAISGSIARIDTRVDPATRAVTARAQFANPGQRIKPGMLMRIAVVQGQRTSPAAPEASVQFEGEGAFVYRIAARGEGSAAQRADVRTGAREAGFIEIVEGLKVGDRIVANGLNRVQPNQPLIIAGAARPAAARAPGGAPPA